MTKTMKPSEFQPGRGYTKQDWDDVSENPPWTKEELASARPFADAFPDIAQKMLQNLAAQDLAQVEMPKRTVTPRPDQKALEKSKTSGKIGR